MKLRAATRALLLSAALALCSPMAAFAQAAAAERIPFKQDEGEFSALMWRSVLVMAGLVVVALGAIYVMRRKGWMPPVLGAPAAGGARLVQTLRLGPRASLFVVQFEGRRILIGQSERGLGMIADAEAPPPPAPEERE